jgi:single-strand DNA-binding protein
MRLSGIGGTVPASRKISCGKERVMSDLNHVCLIGRVTKNVEIQYTARGIPIYCFSIANNLNKAADNQWVRVTSFFNFRLLGKRWEGILSWLIKGQLVSIEGRLEQDRWEREGKPRSYLKIAVTEIQPLWPERSNDHAQSQEREPGSPDDEIALESLPEDKTEVPPAEGEQ